MRRVSFVILSLALAGAATAQTPMMVRRAAPPPPKLTIAGDSVVVPMRIEGRAPLIEVTVGGRGPYTFVLDTGAGGSVFSKALAETLGLRVTGVSRVGSPVAGGTPREASLIEVDRLEVGGVTLEKMSAVAMDLSPVGLGAPGGPQGVLSSAAFHGALVAFDFAGGRLVLRRGALPAPDGRNVFGWDSTARLPQVPVDLPGGQRQVVHVDTGSPAGLSLPASWAEKLPLAAKPESTGVARTIDHTFVRRSARMKGTASIGHHRFENPEVTFAEEIVTGNVGMGWLRDFRLTLDPANRRIRLEPAPKR
jgi:hypothetical protein